VEFLHALFPVSQNMKKSGKIKYDNLVTQQLSELGYTAKVNIPDKQIDVDSIK